MKRKTEKEIFVNNIISYIAREQSQLFSFIHPQGSPTIKNAFGPGELDLVTALFAPEEENIWIRQGNQFSFSQNKIILSCGDLLTFFIDSQSLGKIVTFLTCLMSV
jgi:hypothetical protein